MHARSDQCDPYPRNLHHRGDSDHRASDEKNVAESKKQKRYDHEQQKGKHPSQGRFRFFAEKRKPALEETYQRINQRQQVAEKTGASRRIAEPRLHPGRRLTPEDHPEHEADPQSGHDRFGWIFAHILLGVVLKRAPAADLKSSAAFRACVLLLSNLSCASGAPRWVLCSSAICKSPVNL